MLKSYQVRLYPNKAQSELIDKTIGCNRFIYNQMLNERIQFYNDNLNENGKFVKPKKFPKYKTEKQYKQEYEWLKEVSGRSLQQSRIDLHAAFQNFFRRVKQGKKPGFPKFKSKHKSKWSYREPQTGNIVINNNKIKLIKLGYVKFRGLNNRPYDKIKSVTVIKTRSDKYVASILVETKMIQKEHKNDILGLDLGIKEFAVDSNGNLYKSISKRLFEKEKELKKIQKHFSRKIKGSNRREKCRIKLAEKYEEIVNIRNFFHWHLANKLCSENQTIVVENLKVSNMIKNRKLSHSISYLGWSSFIVKLEQKAKEYNTKIVKANQYYASSKTCSSCGSKKNELALKDRTYICNKCGFTIDRDINAALNLKSLEYSDNSRGEEINSKEIIFNFSGIFYESITNK
jgi:putative transposase